MIMGTKTIQRCTDCGVVIEEGYCPRCPRCAGLVEVFHDLDGARVDGSADSTALRYFDYLPVADRHNVINLGEGNTPCIHARKLGNLFGLDLLYLKVEGRNPSGSTKDRMAAIVLSIFKELGLTEFVSSSTGNSSNALARGIGLHPEFQMHLFIGGDFASRFRYANDGVRLHVLEGFNFTDTFNHSRDYATRHGMPFEGGFFNWGRREGLKLAYFEAVEQIPHPINWYVQAASSAMGVYGTWKGALELVETHRIAKSPRMVCVQQESCAPIVSAFEDDSPEILPQHIVSNPDGIAKAILRGNPSGCYPYVREMLLKSNGRAVRVTEQEIIEARTLLNEFENLDCCYASAATIAAVRKMSASGDMATDDCVLLNLTGGGHV